MSNLYLTAEHTIMVSVLFVGRFHGLLIFILPLLKDIVSGSTRAARLLQILGRLIHWTGWMHISRYNIRRGCGCHIKRCERRRISCTCFQSPPTGCILWCKGNHCNADVSDVIPKSCSEYARKPWLHWVNWFGQENVYAIQTCFFAFHFPNILAQLTGSAFI